MKGPGKKYDIFISYRRDRGSYMAMLIRDRLSEMGYRVFLDVSSISSGNFNETLFTVIDGCRDFLVVLSPNALDHCAKEDDWVRRELERALQGNKNIIPILMPDFSFPETLPESINAIRYKSGLLASPQYFDAFVERLKSFLHTRPHSNRRAALAALAIGGAIGLGRARLKPGRGDDPAATQIPASTDSPTPGTTPAPTPTSSPTPSTASPSFARAAATGMVNMRDEPSLNGATLGALERGESVELLGDSSVDSRGVVWYHVRAKNLTGWVSSRHLDLGENSAST